MAETTEKIALEVVTPERRVLADEVDEVVLPSTHGYLGVLPGHAPLLAMLDVGEVSYRTGTERRSMAVTGGFAEVLGGSVSILAKTSELAGEIDIDRARRAKERAEAELKKDLSEQQMRHAEVKLKRALCRIQVHSMLQR